MKKYVKPTIIAKNLPSGSYAAGCPSKGRGGCFLISTDDKNCKKCDRSA